MLYKPYKLETVGAAELLLLFFRAVSPGASLSWAPGS